MGWYWSFSHIRASFAAQVIAVGDLNVAFEQRDLHHTYNHAALYSARVSMRSACEQHALPRHVQLYGCSAGDEGRVPHAMRRR